MTCRVVIRVLCRGDVDQFAMHSKHLSLAELGIILAHQPEQLVHRVVVGVVNCGQGIRLQDGPFIRHNPIRRRHSSWSLDVPTERRRADGIGIGEAICVYELSTARQSSIRSVGLFEIGQNGVLCCLGSDGETPEAHPRERGFN